MKSCLVYLLSVLALVLTTNSAQAQLNRGILRLSLDMDMLSVAVVDVDDEDGPGHSETTVFGLGPNQLGGSYAVVPFTPLGVGVGYGISPKVLLGLRTGLGLDIIDNGGEDNARALGLSLMPGITIVPLGQRAKLFLNLSAIFQVNRLKLDDFKERVMMGGFSTGIGALIFPASGFSVDLGFFFEGRFGGREREDSEGGEQDVQDLRGVVRLGFSLWT